MAQDTQVLIIGDYYDVPRQRLIDQYPCAIYEDAADPAALLAEIAPTCRAIASHAPVTAALMDALPHLGVIANFGVGYDLVDVAAADARGIKVTNTPDVLNDEVADLAVGLMLATCRRMIKADAYVRAGRWAVEGNMAFTQRVWGKRLGLLGMGRIGREIADQLIAEGVPLLVIENSPEDARAARERQLEVLEGDATLDETLQEA
ncbi:MAG: NAD(P)-dependent oxidoreductase, partial [Pseudomonadota bacterium]|nr:NAD(P)-dependent oxidoreductase [Pseudomonadota bacterium]